jgi:aminoglycoside 3-N-acetyltransferase
MIAAHQTLPPPAVPRRGPIAAGADALLLAAERLARQVFWTSPRLRSWARRWQSAQKPAAQVAGREELKRHLRQIGVRDGALVMAHTSVTGLQLTELGRPDSPPERAVVVAAELVDDLLELVGPTGTLAMPSHAAHQWHNEYAWPVEGEPPQLYDPQRTPCGVGLANELFWRRKSVLRSLHPHNSLAATGPLAAELLHNNLNEHKPLPHGVYSGYYRFCQMNGLVISIGVPLGRYLTLIHVAEEVRDGRWPISDFFADRPYVVRIDGEDRPFVVRQHRLEYGMYCLCMRKLHRDLLAAGILHEGTVGSVRVDWARAREVFDYMMSRNARTPYPYYWPWLVRRRGGTS